MAGMFSLVLGEVRGEKERGRGGKEVGKEGLLTLQVHDLDDHVCVVVVGTVELVGVRYLRTPE